MRQFATSGIVESIFILHNSGWGETISFLTIAYLPIGDKTGPAQLWDHGVVYQCQMVMRTSQEKTFPEEHLLRHTH